MSEATGAGAVTASEIKRYQRWQVAVSLGAGALYLIPMLFDVPWSWEAFSIVTCGATVWIFGAKEPGP